MKTKKGLQMSFAWIFAIIVGIIILFLAIYMSTRFIQTEQTALDAKTAKEIGVLLNPLETGFESGKITSLALPSETRIYNKCNTKGMFGKQIIQISQKSFNKWTETDVDVGFANKYIFSEKYVEGKNFYLFSKPFEFPFKVANLIYLTSSKEQYCFLDTPDEIKSELLSLNHPSILLENCSDSSIKVCFVDGPDCDVGVYYNLNYVKKGGEKMYFEGDALMYAAIFSGKEVYECQLKRLMKRVENLALLYKDKAVFISRTGCSSNLNPDLLVLGNLAKNLESSANLNSINYIVEDIQNKNDDADCNLW